jgi:hypothetical protein
VCQSRHLDFYQFETYDLEESLQLHRQQIFTGKWTLNTTTTGPTWGVYLQRKDSLGLAVNLWQHPESGVACSVILPPVPKAND